MTEQNPLEHDTETELLEAFDLYDRDADGLLTAADVFQTFNLLGLGFRIEDLELGLIRLSLCGKNYITPTEFISLVGQAVSSPEIVHILNEIFE
ncbi:unnamed protein product [Echinostoma caproni]|uniref:EF-hand domain-containing protein n=1 Tax=Echinostoma caproni TaxID=27848 RepID=A0A183BFV8_9TREM|nr:unnamed protein product [Echinostoma caproni]